MKTENKTPVPSAGARTIRLSEIIADNDMRVRSGSLSPQHVTELRQAVKRGSKLPPVLVWQEVKDGEPTGRFIILDGRHRLAALRKEKPKLAEIMAEVFTGSRVEALLMAAKRNTKAVLPLTSRDRTNAAWAVVRMDGEPYGISKSATAKSCGVSDSTVAKMRARWKAWHDGREPSGDWRRDAMPVTEGEWEPPTDAENEEFMRKRDEATDKLAMAFLKASGMTLEKDLDLCCDAIERMMGHRFAYLLDRVRPPEDELPSTGLEGDFDAVKVDF